MHPELGQALFGHCQTYEIDPHADALISAVLSELGRVYWNKFQTKWNHESFMPSVETRPYYWGDDDAEMEKPNLSAFGVEISWYKYPGRSMSVNKDMSVNEWADWFYRVLGEIRRYEKGEKNDRR